MLTRRQSTDTHPAVFAGGDIDFVRMVETAQAMRPDTLPPVIRLRVIEEDNLENGRDFFELDGRSELLFTSPASIARVFHGTPYRRRMIVSAEDSVDPFGRGLSFRWSVLQGDPAQVGIRPLDETGRRVELTIAWQPRHPVRPGEALESNRIEIAAFANNGTCWSAPAFITWLTLDNEERVYDAEGRIRSVTYTGADEVGNYVDPELALPKSWRDVYAYDAEGRCTGWTRDHAGRTERFTADGRRIIAGDGATPVTRQVRYVAQPRGPEDIPILVQIKGRLSQSVRHNESDVTRARTHGSQYLPKSVSLPVRRLQQSEAAPRA